MILLVDNYDSFSYNLYQYIGEIRTDIRVIRNDELTVEEIRAIGADHIIISPGPGRPEDAGVIVELIRTLGKETPTLGVCLGHQAICLAFGAQVIHAAHLMHGKSSEIWLDQHSPLFAGCGERTTVARYHSLAADRDTIPEELQVIAATDDGEVMAVAHRAYPIYGVQFHPESILTPEGHKIIGNFLMTDQNKF